METDGKCVNHRYLTQDLSTFLPSNINHLAEIEKKRTFFYKTNETFKSLQKLDWLYLSLSKLCSFGRFLVTTAY